MAPPPSSAAGEGQGATRRAWAADAMTVLQTSELVHASIDASHHLAAARHLMRGRALHASLLSSPSDAVVSWREMPFVRQQCAALSSPSLSTAVVAAATSFLRGTLSKGDGFGEKVGDALAAVSLVKAHTVRDAMETFLEARAACSAGLCKGLTAQKGGSDELLGGMGDLRDCLVQTVEAAFELFAEGGSSTPLLPRLLSFAGTPPPAGVPEALVAQQCLEWAQTQAAAAKASSRAGLQTVSDGVDLARVETALRSQPHSGIPSLRRTHGREAFGGGISSSVPSLCAALPGYTSAHYTRRSRPFGFTAAAHTPPPGPQPRDPCLTCPAADPLPAVPVPLQTRTRLGSA